MSISSGGIKVIVAGLVSSILAIVAVALRLWSRKRLHIRLAFNDYMIFAALLFAIIIALLVVGASFLGAIGNHAEDIQESNAWILGLFLKVYIAAQIFWAAGNTCVKLSILSLYIHLFPTTRFTYACYFTMVISILYFISVFLEAFLLCQPVQYNWDKSVPDGRCGNQHMAYMGSGITNLIVDAWIVALPMPMLFGLQMSWTKKCGVAAIFSFGAA
ncbi:hypothetical protein F4780DRAFT_766196 [Xylariomycetidae sp. FL0641]|nr:hypothetical protein F4780DRAFT_766196 [Xylariomycetidae sp. FL0641]